MTISKAFEKSGLYTKRTIAAAFLLACVDGVAAEGKYGGKILDSFSFHQAANNYRYVGRIGHELGKFVWWAVSDFTKDFKALANKHGQPRP